MSEIKVQPRPGTPLYVSVKEAVLGAVERGRYQPGEQLPSTKALAAKLGVSLVTLHRALQELVTAGVLRRGQGRGTFVHESFESRKGRAAGLRLGVVLAAECSLADGFHAAVLEGVRRGAVEAGADLVLPRFGEDARGECHGYLLVNPWAEQLDRPLRFGRRVREPNEGLAIVVVGARVGRAGWVSVEADNAGMARAAVTRLHEAGHRRIGFVGAGAAGGGGSMGDAERVDGFLAQCARLGCEASIHGSWSGQDGAAGLARLLGPRPRPTALVAGGLGPAVAVRDAAGRAGLGVPADLSVVSLEDVGQAGSGLTGFRQPLEEMGRAAVSHLVDLATRAARPAPQTTLGCELVERGSVGPPRGG